MNNYLIEIKYRSLLIFFFFIFNFTSFYLNKEFLLFSFVKVTYVFNKNLSNFWCSSNYYLTFMDVTEIFYAYFHVLNFCILQLAFYYVLSQVFFFFLPALFKKENNKLFFFFKISFCCFLLSFFISYFFIVPIAWNFFLNFQNYLWDNHLNNLYFEANLTKYLFFCINVCFGNFLFFQLLAFVTLFLIKLSLKFVKKYRKVFYFLLIIIVFFISPFDFLLGQLVVFLLLFFFFEVLLFYFIIKKYFLLQ